MTQASEIVDLAVFVERADHAAGEQPVAVAVSDMDGLAAISESFGVEAAVRGLAAWERTLTGRLPGEAVVARISGDEWAVALPGATAESALIKLEQIRSQFSSHRVDGIDADLDVSIGIAARPPHARTVEEATRAAVEALMRAKREGRGRVVIYVEEKMTLKSNYYSRIPRPPEQALLRDRPHRSEPAPRGRRRPVPEASQRALTTGPASGFRVHHASEARVHRA